MINEQQYQEAVKIHDESQKIINQYFRESQERFQERMKNNPVFNDDELHYSRVSRCPCGAGLAYPKKCGPNHYWDCSSILKGVASTDVQHTDRLPFSFWNVKGERDNESTRPA